MKTGRDKTKNTSSGNVSRVVGTLVAGAAVGLAAGILLAPDKGKKTRARLLDDAKDLSNKLKERAHDIKERADECIEEKTDQLKEKATDTMEKVNSFVSEKATDAKEKVNDIKGKANDGLDAIANKG